MNKARITYRFGDRENPVRRQEPQAAGSYTEATERNDRQRSKVIPLYEEEFSIMEETRRYDRRELEDRLRHDMRNASGAPSEEDRWAVQADAPIRDPQALNQFTTDFGAWSSPFDQETDRVERTIRESQLRRPDFVDHPREKREYAYENREVSEPARGPYTDWEQPEATNDWEGPRIARLSSGRRSGTPLLKVGASIMAAAVTGVVLGFVVLSLFNGDVSRDIFKKKDPAAETVTPSGNTGTQAASGDKTPGAAVPVNGSVKNGGSAAVAATAVAIPAQNYSFLQLGTFSTQQSAETFQAELKQKGIPSVTEPSGDKYFLYGGVAATNDKWQTIKETLQQKKIDSFVKTVSLPALSSARWNGKTDALSDYMAQSGKLVQMISGLTLVHLEESKPTALDQATMQSLKAAGDTWNAAAKTAEPGVPEEAKAAFQKMNAAFSTALQTLDQYKQSPSAGLLWQTQSGLLQNIIAEKAFMAAIAGT